MNLFRGRFLPLGAGSIVVVLGLGGILLRSAWLDRARSATAVASTARFSPNAYYNLINTEIAPHLEYCPLYGDVSSGDDQTADAELAMSAIGDDAENEGAPGAETKEPPKPVVARLAADDRCECLHRLSPFLCLESERHGMTEELRKKIEYFRDHSWLARDLETKDRWKIETKDRWNDPREGTHVTVSLVPGIRSERLAGQAELGFKGSILYRGGRTQGVLVDEGGNVHELVAATRPGPDGELRTVTVPVGAWRALQKQALDEGHALKPRIEDAWPTLVSDSGRIELRPFDGRSDKLLAIAGESSRGSWIAVDGATVKTVGKRHVFALEPGQQLQLRAPGGDPLVLRLAARRGGVLSEPVIRGGRLVRTFDADSGVEDLLRSLEAPLDTLIGDLDEGTSTCSTDRDSLRALASSDIVLSLEQQLQDAARTSLRTYAENLPTHVHFEQGLWFEGGRLVPPPQLRLLVMDADQGDVLAMASYPDAAAIRDMLKATSAPPHDKRTDLQPLLEHLDNERKRTSPHFESHPIGSLFKPLFAWAAGEANPALLAFTVPTGKGAKSDRQTDWKKPDPWNNRLLEQCMIRTSAGVGNPNASHFGQSYDKPKVKKLCDDVESKKDQVSLCSALSASDTYWFLELGARVQALRRGYVLPPAGAPANVRDKAYHLANICNQQLQTMPNGTTVNVCVGAKSESDTGLMPLKCHGSQDLLCQIAGKIGAQPQAVGAANTPGTTIPFLGPLAEWVTQLGLPFGAAGSDGESNCCPGLRVDVDESFRWVSPSVPQWSRDIVGSCTPGLEVFLGGSGANFWNDVHLAQTYGRLYGPDDQLAARLVLRVGDFKPNGHQPGHVLRPDCQRGERTPRCLVLEGLRNAVDRGTLTSLKALPGLLASRLQAGGAGAQVDVRGKTGTTRRYLPAFGLDAKTGRPSRTTAIRKSVHLALLVGVPAATTRVPGAPPGVTGRALRHFVVYLGIEGLEAADMISASAQAAPYFAKAGPGLDVLERLVDFAQRPGP